MRNHLFYGMFTILTQLVLTSSSFANGYSQNIYLCDMGIRNLNHSNNSGVNYMEYLQNGNSQVIQENTNWTSALDRASQLILNYDRWNPAFSIDNISVNLGSDFYGAQYYLEYCYSWDRQAPMDSIQYAITFTPTLKANIPNTEMQTDTKCSIKFKDGHVVDSDSPQSDYVQTLLEDGKVSMRCTIRLTFKEATGNIQRPHNNDLGEVNPQINVKVEP